EVTPLGGWLGGPAPGADDPVRLVNLATLPSGAFDAAGNWIVASGNQVLRVDAVHGGVTVLAGATGAGLAGDGDAALDARLSRPVGVVIAGSGDTLVADAGNFAVRRVVGAGEAQRRKVRIAQELPLPVVEFMQWADIPV